MGSRSLRVVLVVACLTSGCSVIVDGTLSDKGGTDGGLRDGGSGSCEEASDGTSCGTGLICLSGSCEASVCGDGVVDTEIGEQCDDENDTPGDGCEPELCVFTCDGVADCDDLSPCNGVETCGASHVCEAGVALGSGDACVSDAVPDGVCDSAGQCVPRGCGDGVVNGDEECDDANTDPGDGCEPDCTFTCELDEDCDDVGYCNGEETCEVASHTCRPGTAVTCTPSDACHTSTCSDAAGDCVEALIDGDSDGEAATSLGSCGTDCDDTTAERASGNTELCGNGIDDDCDPATSDAAMTLYYPDCDNDTYAANGTTGLAACMPPASCGGCGCTARAPTSSSNSDCVDNDADARPNQTTYQNHAISGRPTSTDYDYNCNGTETREVTCVNEPTDGSCPEYDPRWGCEPLAFCIPAPCCATGGGSGGWTGSSPPACGSSASYSYCRPLVNPFSGVSFCSRTTITRQQKCL